MLAVKDILKVMLSDYLFC